MAFLRSNTLVDVAHDFYGNKVHLRMPIMADYAEWARLRALSRNFLTRWEPVWSTDELTRAAFKKRIKHYDKQAREGRSFCFLIFDHQTGKMVGGLTLINVRYGVTQSCTLGYWMGEPYANKGFMTDAVNAVANFIFSTLGLHRIEAACLMENTPSIRLLEKCGFEREGIARQYLKINGEWQDHYLYARICPDDLVRR